MKKHRLLIVDDNENFLELFALLPEAEMFRITPCTSAQKAIDLLDRQPFDLVVSDIQMPEMGGIELFAHVQDQHPDIPVILITSFGSTEDAVRAIRWGAFHYFEKPLDDKFPLFWTTVREALGKRDLAKQTALLQKEKAFNQKSVTPIVGQSENIRQVIESVDKVAGFPSTVLISGETGTGKELVARSIHEKSGRRDKPFFSASCGQFAPGILESELFGHEKGAFTGATDRRIGLFEMAHEGTLFLDEISDASSELQAKLLRVLETREFTRMGGSAPLHSNFRIISASNLNLETLVEKGAFRRDLLFRINVYEIALPPLRQRREDISLLAEFYREKFNRDFNLSVETISEKAHLALYQYDWPGNVRELVNVMERAMITCNGKTITTDNLPFQMDPAMDVSDLDLKNMEKLYIRLALNRTGGNKTQAAELLGISRKTLIEKVKKLSL